MCTCVAGRAISHVFRHFQRDFSSRLCGSMYAVSTVVAESVLISSLRARTSGALGIEADAFSH